MSIKADNAITRAGGHDWATVQLLAAARQTRIREAQEYLTAALAHGAAYVDCGPVTRSLSAASTCVEQAIEINTLWASQQ